MRNKRTLGLTAFLAVMLSLIMASSAMAAAPVSNSGSEFVPVEISANINDQPAVFDVTDVATDPDGDETITLAGADYPCGYQDDGVLPESTTTQFNYYPWDLGGQETCDVLVTDGTSYTNVLVNITTTSGGPPPDTVNPVVAISSPANNSTTSDNSTTLTYTATDNSDVAPSCDKVNNSIVGLNEGSNTITVTCTDGAGNVGSASVNVTYTPPPPPPTGPVVISIANATVTEGDAGDPWIYADFQVSLSRSSATDITLNYGTFSIPFLSGQATPGFDYTITAGQKVIPAGQTSAVIRVKITADNKKEAKEVFYLLSFTCDQNVTVQTPIAVGTIIDDDRPPV